MCCFIYWQIHTLSLFCLCRYIPFVCCYRLEKFGPGHCRSKLIHCVYRTISSQLSIILIIIYICTCCWSDICVLLTCSIHMLSCKHARSEYLPAINCSTYIVYKGSALVLYGVVVCFVSMVVYILNTVVKQNGRPCELGYI